MKTILITGATGRLGFEIAKDLVRDNKVILHYFSKKNRILELINNGDISRNIIKVINYDFRHPVDAFFKAIKESVSKLDAAILSASLFSQKTLKDLLDLEIKDIITVNLTSQIILIKYLATWMKSEGKGTIIVLSDLISLREPYIYEPLRPSLPYIASKVAINYVIKHAAMEFGPEVRVVGIAPGWINFPKLKPELLRSINERVPMRRAGEVKEVISLIRFLLDEESMYVNGTVIEIGGGL